MDTNFSLSDEIVKWHLGLKLNKSSTLPNDFATYSSSTTDVQTVVVLLFSCGFGAYHHFWLCKKNSYKSFIDRLWKFKIEVVFNLIFFHPIVDKMPHRDLVICLLAFHYFFVFLQNLKLYFILFETMHDFLILLSKEQWTVKTCSFDIFLSTFTDRSTYVFMSLWHSCDDHPLIEPLLSQLCANNGPSGIAGTLMSQQSLCTRH